MCSRCEPETHFGAYFSGNFAIHTIDIVQYTVDSDKCSNAKMYFF